MTRAETTRARATTSSEGAEEGLTINACAGNDVEALQNDVPVLVEATLALLAQMLSPDRLQGSHATWGLDVADEADALHGRRLDDGNSLDNVLLVDLRAGTVGLTNDVGHTGLVTQESGHVDGLGSVVLGEGLNLSAVAGGPLLWVESHGAMTRRGKLSVRLQCYTDIRPKSGLQRSKLRIRGNFLKEFQTMAKILADFFRRMKS